MDVSFKLSIIIPIYNVSQYIEQCISSLFISRYKDLFEIILVNDGSTDDSEMKCNEIVEKNKSYHIKIISKKNGGLSSARNTGIHNSQGEYLFFLDGDDFVDTKLFGDLLAKLAKFEGQVLMNNYKEFNDLNNKYYMVNPELDSPILETKDKNFFIQYIMNNLQNSMWSAWKYIVRKDFVLENSLYFGENLLCEDIDWTTRLLIAVDSISYSKNNFYIYRTNRKGSIINTNNLKKELDIVDISFNMIDKVNNSINLDTNSKKALINKLLIEIYVLSLMHLQLYDKKSQNILLEKIKETNKVLNLCDSKKMNIIRILIKIFGYQGTSKFLFYRQKVKSKVSK